MSDAWSVTCHACGTAMARIEVVDQTADGPAFDVYGCQDPHCARKTIVVFEPAGGLTVPQQTFVEREIARRGAFFPSDFGAGRGPRNW